MPRRPYNTAPDGTTSYELDRQHLRECEECCVLFEPKWTWQRPKLCPECEKEHAEENEI